MLLFFSRDEMGGQCDRVSYHDALKKFLAMTGREPKMAWMSVLCSHDMLKWSRPGDSEETPRNIGAPGFHIMVSVNLKDPAMYFGVGDRPYTRADFLNDHPEIADRGVLRLNGEDYCKASIRETLDG